MGFSKDSEKKFIDYDAALHKIYSATNPDTFSQLVLPVLLEITSSACVGFCLNALLPGDPLVARASVRNPNRIYWQREQEASYSDHPMARYEATTAPGKAIRVSDHYSSTKARKATRYYQEIMLPMGMEYELTLLLDLEQPQRLRLSMARTVSDYTLEEMDLFSRMGPHIRRAFAQCQVQAQLQALADQGPTRASAWRDVILTPRENEILRWTSTGRTNKQIAELLKVRPATIKTHLENTYQKLGVSNRAAAVSTLRHLSPPSAGYATKA